MKRTRIVNSIFFVKFIIIMLFVFVLFNIVRSVKAAPEKGSEKNLMCTSVKINEGDTLWSLAKEYYTDDYRDLNAYIDEIMLSNNLTSDTIHEGRYLVIPYYAK